MTRIHDGHIRAKCAGEEGCLQKVDEEIKAICTNNPESCKQEGDSFEVDIASSPFLQGLMSESQKSDAPAVVEEEPAQQTEAPAATDSQLQQAPETQPQNQALSSQQQTQGTQPASEAGPKKNAPFFRTYGIIGLNKAGSNNGFYVEGGDDAVAKFKGGIGVQLGGKLWMNKDELHRAYFVYSGVAEWLVPTPSKDTLGRTREESSAGQFAARLGFEYQHHFKPNWHLSASGSMDIGASVTGGGLSGKYASYDPTYFMMRGAVAFGLGYKGFTFDAGVTFAPTSGDVPINQEVMESIGTRSSLNGIAVTIGLGYSW